MLSQKTTKKKDRYFKVAVGTKDKIWIQAVDLDKVCFWMVYFNNYLLLLKMLLNFLLSPT